MFSEEPQGSLASSEVNNILPEEHIITPEPPITAVIGHEEKTLDNIDNNKDPDMTNINENQNEEAVNKFNLRKRTTKPITYKETRKYVKKTVGKQFYSSRRWYKDKKF